MNDEAQPEMPEPRREQAAYSPTICAARLRIAEGEQHAKKGDYVAALACFSSIVDDPSAPAPFRDEAAHASILRALTLEKLGALGEAERVYGSVIDALFDEVDAALRDRVGWAMYDRAKVLERLGRPLDAEAAFDEIIERFGAADGVASLHAIRAHVSKAALLNSVERFGEAVGEADSAIIGARRWRGAEAGEQHARAAVIKTFALLHLGREADVLELTEAVVEALADQEHPATRRQVALLLYNRAYALERSGRREEAVLVLEALGERLLADDDDEASAVAAESLLSKGLILTELQRDDEALETFDELRERFGASESPRIQDAVANGLWAQARELAATGEVDHAIETYGWILDRFDEERRSVTVRQAVASSAYEAAILFQRAGLVSQARTMLEGLLSRFGDAVDLDIAAMIADGRRRLGSLPSDDD